MARYPDTPGFRSRQEWDFRGVGNDELVVACGYEYARESVQITSILKEWLRLEKPRAELFRRAIEKQIALKDVHRALLNYVKVMRLELHRRTYGSEYKPSLSQERRERAKRDFIAALELLQDLSTQFHEIACCERDAEMFETCGREHLGAPGLRFLANYFVADTPWLSIPKADREGAIAIARQHQFIFFRVRPAVESVDELQEKIQKGEALSVTYPGEQEVRLRIRRDASDAAIDEALMQWRKQHLPKSKTTRPFSRWVALKGLAAMRLAHVLSPRDAIRTFRDVYGALIYEPNFWQLRQDSFPIFRQFFDTGEEPRHAETWVKQKRGG